MEHRVDGPAVAQGRLLVVNVAVGQGVAVLDLPVDRAAIAEGSAVHALRHGFDHRGLGELVELAEAEIELARGAPRAML